MQVTKTLVIGLGSTGTEICEMVAERIRWELGRLQRAPWVRFLCVETDINNRPDIIAYEDFIPLTISAQEYSLLLRQPAAYDEQIRFTEWADMETLRRIPDGAVTAGAGNIRMIGRLAFFFPSNYERVHHAIISRLNQLRTLTVAEAQESYSSTSDEQIPDIQFANQGHLVIYIVGTLCGGTCSGLASDFGFFLNLNTQPSEYKIAVFTIPHPGLTATIQRSAERFKKNAYAALVELNQYHLIDRVDGKSIRFPDGKTSRTSEMPYDLLFITSPREVGAEFNQQLNIAIADYIFLNAFVPATLPTAEGVNAPIYLDRGSQAHVFCTFGLSTLEFPAQRVIEACTYRLGAYTLGQWLRRSVEQDTIETWLDGIGLTWEGLKKLLFDSGGIDVAKEAKEPLVNSAMKLVWRRTDDARQVINNSLRALFQPLGAADDASVTSPGSLYRTAMRNRQFVANQLLQNIRSRISQLLQEYRHGPEVARSLLIAVDRRLTELAEQATSLGDPPRDVDRTLNDLERHRSSWFRRRFARRLTKILIGHLHSALQDELQYRENVLLAQALLDKTDEFGTVEQGIISRIRRETRLFNKRIVNLQDRLVTIQNRLNAHSSNLARQVPNVNGVVLFEPEAGGQGTVPEEFRRCLEMDAGQTGITWEQRREHIASEIVATVLSQLSEAVLLPSTTPREQDWLMQPTEIDKPHSWLPEKVLEELLDRARTPFQRLRYEDVLERWTRAHGTTSPGALAQLAATKAKSFLDIDDAHATYGGRSPIVRNRLLLVPDSPQRAQFLKVAAHDFASPKVEGAPDRYRVVFVQNQFRFPLRGVLSIVGETGISRAKCDDFPTFFTRKDVAWVGVTQEEDKRIRKAEELITVAVLLEIIRPAQGALVFDMRTGPGDPGIRKLPLSFRHAAMSLARGELDKDGFPLHIAMDILEDRIASRRQEFRNTGGDTEFVRYLDLQLQRKVGGVVPDWDLRWFSERFMRYCARDRDLMLAYDEVFPPDKDSIKQMYFVAGQTLPGNAGTCERDGIYCTTCGGWVGADEQEAAQNGWRCFVNPQEHYFGYGSMLGG